MSKRIFRKIAYGFSFVLAAVMLFSAVVLAEELPDRNKLGSVNVTLRDSATQAILTDGEISLYKVADTNPQSTELLYVFTREFGQSGEVLVDMPDAALAATLSAYAEEEKLIGLVEAVDENGRVAFDDLTLGLYLMVQSVPSTGYAAFSPFFVTVPLLQDGMYVYEVDASPKMELMVPLNPEPSPTPTPTPTPGPTSTPGPTVTPTPTPVPTMTPPPVIPQTGQLNWPIPVMIICGLLFFSLGWYLLRTEEGTKHE